VQQARLNVAAFKRSRVASISASLAYVFMSMEQNVETGGPLEARYAAFLGTISELRPQLHRYCSRMTGSVLDGEDVVQEALFEAYRKLDQFDETRSLSPWIFRIAHNRCVDFLRRRRSRDAAEANLTPAVSVPAADSGSIFVRPAIEHLVSLLPPMQRSCVLLKDVFDYSLEEIAELVGSTVGGVKGALKRARTKLSKTPSPTKIPVTADPQLLRVLQLYVEKFNRRDWDGVRELISAEAQLRVVDAFAGRLTDSPYFSNYERWSMPWKLSVGEVDGQNLVVVLRRGADTWIPYSFVRLSVADGQIRRIVDYSHCPWIAPLAESVIQVYRS
jgi:RNA polymerase sigma-70 factor (ECF subfamily)